MRVSKGQLAVAFLLSAGLLGAMADEKKEEKFDAKKLEGKWTYVSGEKNGSKVEKDNLKEGKVTIEKDIMTLESPQGKFVLKFTLDAKKNPVKISMKMTEGPAEGAMAEGIIEVKGDDLKLCYSTSGDAPTKFETKDGGSQHLFILKRSK